MHSHTRHRLDGFWAALFGPAVGTEAGRVVTHGLRLAGYPGVYAVRGDGRCFVSAPPALTSQVRQWAPDADTVLDPCWWSDRLPGWQVLGPSEHSFLDHTSLLPEIVAARPASGAEVRDALLGRVVAADWSESGFDSDVANAWLLEDGTGRAVAAANLAVFDDVPADVGVLVAPDARRCGYATAVAAAAARFAVERHGIARWRTLSTTSASRAVATRLGFELDCTQLAVRPA
ncbi:GNAT family N-acetyltransferase [Ruania zhangjianzhongii]|uniref:GNAT family N-acetyltransferase n=1 Tax=Ruania zhangjianzhongii TaxID=2603206 RepID=UPI0011CC4AFC|nr:GNAT family N-acetyltransferase [Ruania zhangjianzhongii]